MPPSAARRILRRGIRALAGERWAPADSHPPWGTRSPVRSRHPHTRPDPGRAAAAEAGAEVRREVVGAGAAEAGGEIGDFGFVICDM